MFYCYHLILEIIADLLIIFFNHTPQYLHCPLLYPLNTTHSILICPLCPSTLTLQDDTSNTLPYTVWSDNERVLLTLADQLKNS